MDLNNEILAVEAGLIMAVILIASGYAERVWNYIGERLHMFFSWIGNKAFQLLNKLPHLAIEDPSPDILIETSNAGHTEIEYVTDGHKQSISLIGPDPDFDIPSTWTRIGQTQEGCEVWIRRLDG